MPYRPGRTVAAVPTSARARCGAFPSPRSVSDCAVTAQHAGRPDLPAANSLPRSVTASPRERSMDTSRPFRTTRCRAPMGRLALIGRAVLDRTRLCL